MKRISIVIAVVLAVGLGFYVYRTFDTGHPAATAPYVAPALTKSYQNSTYNFSLMMPDDFVVSESPDPESGIDTIVLQNTTGDGIQISITPFSEDTGAGYTLTADRIHQDLPDLQVDNQQPVTVGPDYTGLAFTSNNPAFDGASREVWFVFHGNLYQISTYARLDPLLQAIFKTWQFN